MYATSVSKVHEWLVFKLHLYPTTLTMCAIIIVNEDS